MRRWVCPKCGESMEAGEGAIRANCRVCKTEMLADDTKNDERTATRWE